MAVAHDHALGTVSIARGPCRAMGADIRTRGSPYTPRQAPWAMAKPLGADRRTETIGKGSWTADSKTVTADSTTATADGSDVTYLTTDSGQVLTTDAGVPLVVERETTEQLRLAAAEPTGVTDSIHRLFDSSVISYGRCKLS